MSMFICICATWKPMRRSLSTANQLSSKTECDADEAKRELFMYSNVWISRMHVYVCACVRAHRDSGVDRSRSFSLARSLSHFNECVLFHSPTYSQKHIHFAIHSISYSTQSPKLNWEVDVKEKSEKRGGLYVYIHAAFRFFPFGVVIANECVCVKLFKSILYEIFFVFPGKYETQLTPPNQYCCNSNIAL